MPNYDKQVILDTLREIDYIRVGGEIWKNWWREVIGWNVFSSSVIRKKYTLERLKEYIDELHLPLEIVDDKEMTNSFKVYIKKAA